MARIRIAFVDVDLTARTGEAACAVAAERARCVDAEAVVFTWGASFALVNILGAVNAFEARRARAHVSAIDRTRVANGTRMARIRSASIVQMTQQTSFT